MKLLLVVLAVASLAFAGVNEFGVQIGYWNPTGDMGDVYAGNFYFGGQFLAHMNVVAIEASIGYSSLKLDEDIQDLYDLGGLDFSGRLIPITAGVRSYSGAMYGAAGLELDMMSVKIEGNANPANDVDDSDSELGGYIGAGYVTPMGTTGDLDFNVKIHLMEFETDQMWLSFGAGLNF